MHHRLPVVALTLVVSSAALPAAAEQALCPRVAAALDELRASSSPALTAVVRDGRPTFVGGLAEPARAIDPERAARELLGRFGALAGVDDPAELALHSVSEVEGTTFVRFEATHLGRRILGSQVVLSIRGGAMRHVASGARPFGQVREGPVVAPAAAVRAVREASGRGAADPIELAWWQLGQSLVPVWVVPQREASPARDYRYLVEATTATVLWRHDQHLRSEGYVYDPNPVVARNEVSRVMLQRLVEGAGALEGSRARAYQCVGESGDCTGWGGDCRTCGLREHFALPDEDGNYLYVPSEPDLEDPFAEVQGYFHADRVNQWFEDRLGFSRSCGGSRAVNVYVNYYVPGNPLESANAFYGDVDGDSCGDITLGEGLGVDFSYDADVIYHEFTHGVVEATGGLGCSFMGACYDSLGPDWTALGLNEGYADYYSVTITGDPALGEHAGTAGSGGEAVIRTADNDRMCPFDLIGQSHNDGEIFSGAGWDIRELVGAEVADRVLFRVLNALPQDADYAAAAAAILEAVDAELAAGQVTEEQAAGIRTILGPDGRRMLDCVRVIPLDAIPAGHAEEYMGLYTWRNMAMPAGLQWSLTAPRRATRLVYEIDDRYRSSDRLVAHVRVGQPVGVEMSFDHATGLTLTYEEDFAIELEGRAFTLTTATDPPLQPEATYYIALEYACSGGCYLRATGEVEGLSNQVPVAEAGEDLEIELGATATLDGSGSYDPDGDELTYAWTFVSGPAEPALEDAAAALPSLVPTLAGQYVLQLAVEDTEGGRGEDTVTLVVTEPPADQDVSREGGCGCRIAASPESGLASLLRALLP